MKQTRSAKPSELSAVLRLVQELTARATHSESASELFGAVFHTLFACLPFDVGAAVLLEEELELYVGTRQGRESAIGERLIATLRKVLGRVVTSESPAGEVMVRAEFHDLPAAKEQDRDPLDHEIHAVLNQGDRAAGIVAVWRHEPFSEHDAQILEICATLISVHFTNLRSREKIVAMAEIDDLTGVPNRRFFRRQLTQDIARAAVYNVPLSLLIVDVDNFKDINDEFGHAVGDIVLSELCVRIRGMLRTPDWVSRFGGDEFAVVLPHTDLVGAGAVAQRMIMMMNNVPIRADDVHAIDCSMSIGVAQLRASDTTFSDLVRRADDRLYQAKRQGKNRYVI